MLAATLVATSVFAADLVRSKNWTTGSFKDSSADFETCYLGTHAGIGIDYDPDAGWKIGVLAKQNGQSTSKIKIRTSSIYVLFPAVWNERLTEWDVAKTVPQSALKEIAHSLLSGNAGTLSVEIPDVKFKAATATDDIAQISGVFNDCSRRVDETYRQKQSAATEAVEAEDDAANYTYFDQGSQASAAPQAPVEAGTSATDVWTFGVNKGTCVLTSMAQPSFQLEYGREGFAATITEGKQPLSDVKFQLHVASMTGTYSLKRDRLNQPWHFDSGEVKSLYKDLREEDLHMTQLVILGGMQPFEIPLEKLKGILSKFQDCYRQLSVEMKDTDEDQVRKYEEQRQKQDNANILGAAYRMYLLQKTCKERSFPVDDIIIANMEATLKSISHNNIVAEADRDLQWKSASETVQAIQITNGMCVEAYSVFQRLVGGNFVNTASAAPNPF